MCQQRSTWRLIIEFSASTSFDLYRALAKSTMEYIEYVLSFIVSITCNLNAFRIAPLTKVLTHTRFLLTLRSTEGIYRSLLLFRLAAREDLPSAEIGYDGKGPEVAWQIYVMESACPHLGADLSHAEIEECEDTVVAVCPWHR